MDYTIPIENSSFNKKCPIGFYRILNSFWSRFKSGSVTKFVNIGSYLYSQQAKGLQSYHLLLDQILKSQKHFLNVNLHLEFAAIPLMIQSFILGFAQVTSLMHRDMFPRVSRVQCLSKTTLLITQYYTIFRAAKELMGSGSVVQVR